MKAWARKVCVWVSAIVIAAGVLWLTWLANLNSSVNVNAVLANEAIRTAALRGAFAAVIGVLGTILIMYLPRYRWLAASILLITLTPLALGGFWALAGWGISDWDYYFSYHHAIRRMVLTEHTIPLWNPYICGGTAGIGDPEFPLFTPTFLLELVFGVETGFRISIFLATAVGAVGMLFLARKLDLSLPAALLTAIVMSFSSVNILEIVEGHPNVFSFMWIPWIFLAWLVAYQRQKEKKPSGLAILGCGLLLALTFFQGGIYMLMYVGLAFLALIVLLSNHRTALRFTFLAGLYAIGFAAIKLIPALLWLRQFQDEAYFSSAATLWSLHHVLLGRWLHGVETVIPLQDGGWHEYGAYVGPFVLLLALLGATQAWKKRTIRVLCIGVILAVVVSSSGPILQNFFDHASWLPRSSISRIIVFAILPLALLAGVGFDLLVNGDSKRRLLAPLIVGIVALDLMSLTYPLSMQAFILKPITTLPAPADKPIAYTIDRNTVRVDGVDHTRAYAASLAGYGTQSYCSVLSPKPAVRTLQHQEDHSYLSTTAPATTQLLDWSPNDVIVAVTSATRNRLVINANYVAGWEANDKPALSEIDRVATDIPAGSSIIRFSYRAPGARTGFAITIVTIVVSIVYGGYSLVQRFRGRTKQ